MSDSEIRLKFIVQDDGTVKAVLGDAASQARKFGDESENAARRSDAAYSNMAATLRNVLVTVGAVAAAHRAVGEVFAGINLADNLNDISKATGVAVEQLSAYRLAAEASGTSIEGLAQGMRFLARNAIENVETFKDLGVSTRDAGGHLRSTNAILLDVAEVFSKLPDGPEKASAAMKIFGRSGAELIPFLNEGARGLDDWADKAERLGLVISSETAAKADAFNDSLGAMTSAIKGVAAALGYELLDPMISVIDGTIEWTEANKDLIAADVQSWASGLSTAVSATLPVIKEAIGWYNELANGVARWAVGGDQDILSAASRARVSGYNAPGIAEMDAANDARVKGGGLYYYRSNDFVGPIQPRSASRGFGTDPDVQQILDRLGRDGGKDAASARKAIEEQSKQFQIEMEASLAREQALRDANLIRQKYAVDLADKGAAAAKRQFEIDSERYGVDEALARNAEAMIGAAERQDQVQRQILENRKAELQTSLDMSQAMNDVYGDFAPLPLETEKWRAELAVVDAMLSEAPEHLSAVQLEIEKARESTDDWAQSVSSNLVAALDSLTASGNPFDALDVFLAASRRQWLQTLSQDLPNMVRDSMQQIGGLLRNSPAGNITVTGVRGGAAGGGISFDPTSVGYSSQIGGGVGVYDSSGSLIGTGATATTQAPASGESAPGQINYGALTGLAVLGASLAASRADARTQSYVTTGASAGALAGMTLGNSVAGPIGAVLGAIVGLGIALGTEHKPNTWEKANASSRTLLLGSHLVRTSQTSDSNWATMMRLREYGFGANDWTADQWTSFIQQYPQVTDYSGDGRQRDVWQALGFGPNGPENPNDFYAALGQYNARYGQLNAEYRGQYSVLGLFAGVPGDQGNKIFGSNMVGRAAALGLSDGMIKSEMRQMLDTIGIDLPGAVAQLSESYMQSFDEPGKQWIKTQEQYNQAIADTVSLFEDDLPNGVDAVAIAMASMEETTRGSIVNMDTFQKSLDRTVNLAQSFQDALGGGVGAGVGTAFQSILDTGSFNRTQLEASLNRSVVGGVTQLAVGQLQSLITENPIFKSWNAQLFGAVQSGDQAAFQSALARTPEIIDLMQKGVTDLLPVFKQLQKIVDDAIKSDPQTYYEKAAGYEQALADSRFSRLSPYRQRAQARSEMDAFKAYLAEARADGTISAAEAARLEDLGQGAMTHAGAVAGSFQGSARNEALDWIEFVQSTLADVFTQVGDDISYRNIKGDTLTVDQIIVKNNPTATSVAAPRSGNQMVDWTVDAALTSGEADVSTVLRLMQNPQVRAAVKAAVRG